MPTNFYCYKGLFPYNKTSWAAANKPPTDNGVFVSENLGGHTFYQGVYGHPYRITSPNALGSMGGINMENKPGSVENGMVSNAKKIVTFTIANGTGTGDCKLVVQRGSNGESGLNNSDNWLTSFNVMKPNNGRLVVYKTELACPYEIDGTTPSIPFECVYATGISAIMMYDDGSIIDQSVIIARVPAVGKDYPEVLTSEPYWCPGGSVIMYGSGTTASWISGDTLTSVNIAPVAQSIPESAIASNDGILAVACMVAGDGYARWLGYKNGIYKLYQGQTPLNGMPGEKVAIKGHEFVCLAYGSFYARMT